MSECALTLTRAEADTAKARKQKEKQKAMVILAKLEAARNDDGDESDVAMSSNADDHSEDSGSDDDSSGTLSFHLLAGGQGKWSLAWVVL